MIASARTFRLVHWRDAPNGVQRLSPGFALGWVRSWLRSPEQRAEVLEVYQWLRPGARPAKGWMDERDLNAFVLPRIERALRNGELLLVERVPVAAAKPPILPEDKDGPTRGPETAAPTKTWIEFQVTDMSGKPVADVKYEAHLPDGTKKEGSTDKEGLVRFDDLDPGICDFRLVEYDGDAVESLDEAKRREKAAGGVGKGGPAPLPPQAAEDLEGAIADEIYVVAAELKQIGETLLPDHPVRIVDPDSGEQVGKDLVTDHKGVVRAEVPENKPYRIEIVDDSIEPAPAREFHPDLPPAILACLFLDAAGKPLANEPLEVLTNGDPHPMETDEHGRIHADAPLGPCELTMRKQTFVAHALPAADAEKDANLYRFVVQEER